MSCSNERATKARSRGPMPSRTSSGSLRKAVIMPPLEIAGPAGRLECVLDEAAPARSIGPDGLLSPTRSTGLRAAVVLGHPHTEYGGTMHTKTVYQSAKALSRIGCA